MIKSMLALALVTVFFGISVKTIEYRLAVTNRPDVMGEDGTNLWEPTITTYTNEELETTTIIITVNHKPPVGGRVWIAIGGLVLTGITIVIVFWICLRILKGWRMEVESEFPTQADSEDGASLYRLFSGYWTEEEDV